MENSLPDGEVPDVENSPPDGEVPDGVNFAAEAPGSPLAVGVWFMLSRRDDRGLRDAGFTTGWNSVTPDQSDAPRPSLINSRLRCSS